MIAKQLGKGVARSVSLLLVAVSIICVGSPVLAKSANGLSDSTPFDATLGELFDICLDFSGPPLLNETAELVLTVSPAQDVSNVAIQIVLPDEIELVKGDLGWEGDLSAHQQLQQRVVVKVVKVGSYEIQASVEGLTPDGQPVQQRKRLYVATSEKAAAVSEIPVDIPEEPVISSRPEIDVGDQIGEAELVADPEAGLVTLGDDSPKAPKVIREEGVQIEGDGEAELVADPEAGLVTLGHDSPRAPKLIRQKGVQIEGDGEAELVADPQAGLVTLGDGSPRAPKVIREESVQIEGYGEAELVADRKAGLVTLGDDSPNPPKVTEEGDIFARGSRDAIAGNSPDLVVDDIWSTTAPLAAGEWEGIRFRESNQGTTWAGFHRIRMRFDGSALYYWDCSGLGAGSSAEGSVNLKTSTPGSHQICIDADYTNVVPEWNEGNNTRCETWSWGGTAPGGADLVVEDIWSTTTPLTAGQWEGIRFRERNQGTTSAGFHRIRMRVDGSALYYWDCSSLGAGSSAVGSVNLKTSTPGSHQICIDTDYTGQVPESNEGNNTRCETWSWGGAAPGGADLVVDDIWSTTAPLTAGQWEGIRFRESNQGTTSAGFHRIRMRFDGSALYYWSCSGLGAGRSAEGSVNLKTSTPGSHEVCIDTDYTSQVPESNEGNNTRCETWSWGGTAPGGADLVVEDIWSTTAPLAAGEWEGIRFRERNQGTTSAGFHRIRMRFDGSALYYWSCSGLGVGSSAVGSVNLRTSTPGSHQICIDTDYTGQVPESNEGNNTLCETWSWGGTAPGDEKILSVPAKRQEQTQWCWAGCAQMVLAYYGTNAAQCDMANFAWGRSDCCANPSSSNCNLPNAMYGTSGSLQSILSNWGVNSTPQASNQSFNDVQSQINSNWPLIARWGWTGGGGHFLVIRGYRISNTNVHYVDPWDGAYHTSTYTWFDNDGNHDWTHTLMNVN